MQRARPQKSRINSEGVIQQPTVSIKWERDRLKNRTPKDHLDEMVAEELPFIDRLLKKKEQDVS